MIRSSDQRFLEAERLSVITQRIGFAIWQIQELEGGIATYFVLRAQATKGMGIVDGNELLRGAFKKTFGATIREIERAGVISKELEGRFYTLLNERNWLVHRSRTDGRNAVRSDAAARQVVNRINIIANESLSLLKEVGELVEKYVRQSGITPEQIESARKHVNDNWYSSEVW